MIHLDQFADSAGGSLDYASADARPDFAPNATLPRHRWFRFKEGFSAGLVADFVETYLPKKGGRLLDPFLGSGTTAVEGASRGHLVAGIETNPFMAFLSRVKTGDYSRISDIEGSALRCLGNRAISAEYRLPSDSTLVERKGLKKWLLNRSVAQRFEQIRTAIENERDRSIRAVLTLALVACVEEVANARKDGKCWRYRSGWQSLRFDGQALENAFESQVIRVAEDIERVPKLSGSAIVCHGDSRETRITHDGGQAYHGLLTSPPYLNSFDYTDIYRPEMFLLNAARTSQDLRAVRFKTVRSHVQVAWEDSKPLGIPLLQKKVNAIAEADLWSSRIPQMVNAYFVDLDIVVRNCAARLRKGATAGFVVADSAYNGVVVPVGVILSEILERRGFKTKKLALFRQTLGNGHHQQRSKERLNEVMVLAEYSGKSPDLVGSN